MTERPIELVQHPARPRLGPLSHRRRARWQGLPPRRDGEEHVSRRASAASRTADPVAEETTELATAIQNSPRRRTRQAGLPRQAAQGRPARPAPELREQLGALHHGVPAVSPAEPSSPASAVRRAWRVRVRPDRARATLLRAGSLEGTRLRLAPPPCSRSTKLIHPMEGSTRHQVDAGGSTAPRSVRRCARSCMAAATTRRASTRSWPRCGWSSRRRPKRPSGPFVTVFAGGCTRERARVREAQAPARASGHLGVSDRLRSLALGEGLRAAARDEPRPRSSAPRTRPAGAARSSWTRPRSCLPRWPPGRRLPTWSRLGSLFFQQGGCSMAGPHRHTKTIGRRRSSSCSGSARDCGKRPPQAASSATARGQVRTRIGLNMIERAEASCALKPGMEVVEPTSATPASRRVSLRRQGLSLTLVMPETMSQERRTLLLLLGQVVLTPGALGLRARWPRPWTRGW